MDVSTLGTAGELGVIVILSQTILELVKFKIHKHRVSQGKAHDSLTPEEHAMLEHLRNDADIYPACRKFQHDTEMLSNMRRANDTLDAIERTLKRSYPPR